MGLTYLLSCRLVLSRFEFEEVSSGENALEVGEDEEEVWLFWRDSNKEIRSKSIRELAQDAKEGQKEDRDVLSYYRLTARATFKAVWERLWYIGYSWFWRRCTGFIGNVAIRE